VHPGEGDQTATIVGIDVGLSFIDRTTGICLTTSNGDAFLVGHVYADRASRMDFLDRPTRNGPLDVVAIDGPLLPGLRPVDRRRNCERAFVCAPFQRRCKPGESHVRGTGQALRRAAADAAHHVAELTSRGDAGIPFPRVVEVNIVEAFPNAFLGVLLPEAAFDSIPTGRGQKFDGLFEAAKSRTILPRLLNDVGWPDDGLAQALVENTQHDERAALICALTAVCVWRGRYTAVGDAEGGWFLLPPWDLWQQWARSGIEKADVAVWRDGAACSGRDT
jgi:predicted RNase H-like nuclease